MRSSSTGFTSIDNSFASFPEEIQKKLKAVWATIKAAAPDAQEKTSYQMPTNGVKPHHNSWWHKVYNRRHAHNGRSYQWQN